MLSLVVFFKLCYYFFITMVTMSTWVPGDKIIGVQLILSYIFKMLNLTVFDLFQHVQCITWLT